MDKFIYTTAIKKLRNLKKRKRVVPGGSSAGKTFGILPILIDKAARTPYLEISVVSETLPHLKRGALKDFKSIMRVTNRWIDAHWHGTDMKYTFGNKATIEFFSADDAGKLKGPRRNILYINECDRIDFESYNQLAMRTSGDIWLDFNPAFRFWVHDELSPSDDCEWLTLTYLDNEGCPDGARQELEIYKRKAETSKYWDNKWKVYGLGQLGSLDGVVFEEYKEWEVCDNMPNAFDWSVYGLDFGYTNDVTSIVNVSLSQGELWLDEITYKTGLTNKMICDVMEQNGISRHKEVFADSSEPKSIEEIYGWGWKVKGATKGRDSIHQGIDVMKRYKMNVTSRSENLLTELRKYAWDKDKEGKTMLTPVDKDNHAIDAARYAITMKLGVKQHRIIA